MVEDNWSGAFAKTIPGNQPIHDVGRWIVKHHRKLIKIHHFKWSLKKCINNSVYLCCETICCQNRRKSIQPSKTFKVAILIKMAIKVWKNCVLFGEGVCWWIRKERNGRKTYYLSTKLFIVYVYYSHSLSQKY